MEVPNGALVTEENGFLKIVSSESGVGETWHNVPAVCQEEEYRPVSRAAVRVPAWGQKCDLNSTADECRCDSPPCTCNTLPCNSWMDNAGFWTHPQSIGGMSSVYTAPSSPPVTGGQTQFWFIGTENTDGLPRHGNGASRTILQPVLTYNPLGWCKNSSNGWCISSWNCCPAGVTTHSPYIQDVKPGEKYLMSWNMTQPDIYEVVSQIVSTGQKTTLQALGKGRNFNWADITLEVYAMSECSQFSGGPMTFGEIALWDSEMKPITVDKWLLTSKRPCGGKVTQIDAKTITMEHSPTAADEVAV